MQSFVTTWLSDDEYLHAELEVSEEPGVALPAAAQRLCCSPQLSVVASPVYVTACTSAALYCTLEHCHLALDRLDPAGRVPVCSALLRVPQPF